MRLMRSQRVGFHLGRVVDPTAQLPMPLQPRTCRRVPFLHLMRIQNAGSAFADFLLRSKRTTRKVITFGTHNIASMWMQRHRDTAASDAGLLTACGRGFKSEITERKSSAIRNGKRSFDTVSVHVSTWSITALIHLEVWCQPPLTTLRGLRIFFWRGTGACWEITLYEVYDDEDLLNVDYDWCDDGFRAGLGRYGIYLCLMRCITLGREHESLNLMNVIFVDSPTL